VTARELLSQLRAEGFVDPDEMVDEAIRQRGEKWLYAQTDHRSYWSGVANQIQAAHRRENAPAVVARKPSLDFLDAVKAVPRGNGKYEHKLVRDLTLTDCLAIAADYRADEATARREAKRWEQYASRLENEGVVCVGALSEFVAQKQVAA
jgi:hypothetical protein